MTGPQRLESDQCWWCNKGKHQSRHHLFIECRTWTPQIRRLWTRIAKDWPWEDPRAPSVRKLWKAGTEEAVLEFLGDTRVGARAAAEQGRARADEDRDEEEVSGQEGEEGGPGPP